MMLRANKHVQLAPHLRDGSRDFELDAKNPYALRTDVNERREPLRELVSIDDMRQALLEQAGKIVTLLRRLDTDGDGQVPHA